MIGNILSLKQIQDEPMGRLIVDNSKNNRIKPEYYINFTIQRLLDGRWQTLDFEYDPKFQRFPEPRSRNL